MRDPLYRNHGGMGLILPKPNRPLVMVAQRMTYDTAPPDAYQKVVQVAEQSSMTEADLMSFRFVLTTSGDNDNKQYFVEDELALPEVYMSAVDEAIDVDHLPGFDPIVGEIYHCEFFESSTTFRAYIQSYGYLFQKQYPKEAFKVRRGAQRWAAVSMEAWPNPLEQVGQYKVIHMPKFIGAGLVRFPGNRHSKIDQVDGRDI